MTSAMLPIVLLVSGFVLGLLTYYTMLLKTKRRVIEPFIGGESTADEMKFTGNEFYKQIKDTRFLNRMYYFSEKKFVDIYEVLRSVFRYFTAALMSAHTGMLGTYLTWLLFGMLILLYIYIRW